MKHIKRWVSFFFVLLGIYLLFKQFLLSNIFGWLTTYVKFDTIETSDFLSVVSGVVSVIIAFLSDYYFKHNEKQMTSQREAPYINICTVQGQSLSSKRYLRNNRYVQIELGIPQREFRYVYSRIENTGKSAIVNCTIASKSIPYQIKPQTEYPLCFLVYEPAEPKPKRRYIIKYRFADEKGNSYRGSYTLKMDTDKQKVSFHIKQKQKEI